MNKLTEKETMEIVAGMKDISDEEYLHRSSNMLKERRIAVLKEAQECRVKIKLLDEDMKKVKLEELKNVGKQLRKQFVDRRKDLLTAFKAMGVDLKHHVSIHNRLV